ncbi:hypothetical protein H0G86_003343 [Trichoderma simmonsii]|uniref:Uncharacterized protein n=1 Tax=Trichoderma simmonsii TaxID=1491479 RepID=A0A8G0LA34_9HYPO|nr:hypothetical protein H0G86_003343 [Trichoderma simmonsii]
MPDNNPSSYDIYRFAVYMLRGLTLLCWLCQQLQQLTAHIVYWMDKERERRNRDVSDIRIIDLDDVDPENIDMNDIEMEDVDIGDTDVDNEVEDIDMDDVDSN